MQSYGLPEQKYVRAKAHDLQSVKLPVISHTDLGEDMFQLYLYGSVYYVMPVFRAPDDVIS